MTNDHHRWCVDMAIEIKDEVVTSLSIDDPPECELCGAKRFQQKYLPSASGAEYYTIDCLDSGCDGTVSFVHRYLEVGDMIQFVKRDFPGLECSASGCSRLLTGGDLIDEREPYHTEEFDIPVKAILTTTIAEHHTSYVPEETILVCNQCHGRIHGDNDFHPELQPDMKRKEWEELQNE